MRQGHQNRRGRGRNNNNQNRKGGQNPLTRTFESNGPDVKIRGTPSHIAEKYISLARDAKASGDEVLAESYLQHAEHYNRIIMAYREQQISQMGENAANMGQRFRVPQLQDGPEDDEFGEDGGDDLGGDPQQQPIMRGNEPQPNMGQPPFDGNDGREQRSERQDHRQDYRPDRQDRHDRQGGHRYDDRRRNHDQFRGRDRDRGDRGDRGDRDFRRDQGFRGGEGDFGRDRDRDRDRGRFDRPDRSMEPGAAMDAPSGPPAAPATVEGPSHDAVNGGPPPQQRPRPEAGMRGDRERGEGREPRESRRRERFQGAGPGPANGSGPQQHEQPEFLRRPVRRPRREAVAPEGEGGSETNGAVPHTPPSDDTGSKD